MAILSGGATGLLGVFLQRYFDLKGKQHDLEILKVNNQHALDMADKDLAKSQAEWAARKDIATTEAGAAVATADRDLAAREAEAAAGVQEASYGNDKASYFTGAVLRSKSRVVLWIMAAVDGLRGAIRPVLTGYLVWVAHAMYSDLQQLMAKHGTELPIATVQELLVMVMQTLLYLATAATLWWFGSRPAPAPRASKG